MIIRRTLYMTNQYRIGVFLCHCGGNISDVIKLDKIEKKYLKMMILYQLNTMKIYVPQKEKKIIKDQILRENLDRVVISACSKITHGETFQIYKTIKSLLFEMSNIREQCSWVTKHHDDATNKALSLINSSIEAVKYDEPLEKFQHK